jgi:hypothetical protein
VWTVIYYLQFPLPYIKHAWSQPTHLISVKGFSMSVLYVEGVGRDVFTGEFCSDTSRDGVSSVKGDSLLVKVTEKKKVVLISSVTMTQGSQSRHDHVE